MYSLNLRIFLTERKKTKKRKEKKKSTGSRRKWQEECRRINLCSQSVSFSNYTSPIDAEKQRIAFFLWFDHICINHRAHFLPAAVAPHVDANCCVRSCNGFRSRILAGYRNHCRNLDPSQDK